MTDVAIDLANALLIHHRRVCVPYTTRPVRVQDCTIPYAVLCANAGRSTYTRNVGRYLKEVAQWCVDEGYPPLNALAVNATSGNPGDQYSAAPGCNLATWPAEAERSILFRGYKTTAP